MLRKPLLPAVFLLALLLLAGGCGPRESGQLPPIGFKVVFEKHSIPKEMKAGERATAAVQFRNASSLTWPSKPNSKKKYEVNLSYHWLNNNGEMVVFDGLRTGMPNDLKAGESVELKPEILAPDKPGTYVLEVTLVQEGNAWFPERDGDKIIATVAVVDGKSTATVPAVVPAKSPPASALADGQAKQSESKDSGDSATEKKTKKSRKEKRREAREKAKAEPAKSAPAKAPDAQPAAQGKPVGTWAVQVAAFTDAGEAKALASQLKNKGHDAYVVVGQSKGKSWHRVRVGRFKDRADAEKLQVNLKAKEKASSSTIVKN